jgi:apolipoprotein D and lipocalin family protein
MRFILVTGMVAMTARRAAAEPVRTVDDVDLNRYLGDWFEIGRLPNRFQRDCAGDVRATYARRPDGRLDVLNQCRTGDGRTKSARGVARVPNPAATGRLEVRFAPAVLSFLPFVWGDYWILGLADDYSWAVVGSPDRRYLWILARTVELGQEALSAALSVARANGFDVGPLIRTSHSGARS